MIWNESTALQLNDWATESMWLSKAQRLTLHICTPIHRWCGSVQTVVESSRSFSSCARGPFSAVLPPVRTSPAWLCVGRQLWRHRSLGSTAYQQHHTAHCDLGKCKLLKTKHNKRKQTIYNIFKTTQGRCYGLLQMEKANHKSRLCVNAMHAFSGTESPGSAQITGH